MADIRQEVVTKIVIDNKDAVKALDNQEKATEGVNKATEETAVVSEQATGALDSMASSLGLNIGAMKKSVSGVKGLVNGMKSLKVALAATGIGLVVLALTAMVAWMKRTEEGGDKLSEIMAGVSGVMEGLFDVLSSAGKIAFEVFVAQIKVAINVFEIMRGGIVAGVLQIRKAWASLKGDAEAIAEINKEIDENNKKLTKSGDELVSTVKDTIEAVKEEAEVLVDNVKKIKEKTTATIALQKIENQLNKDIRKNTVDEAKRRNEIQKNLLITRDFSKSFEERSKALKRATVLELESLAAQESIAATEFKLAKERDLINDSDAAARQAVADAEANLINVRTASFARQRELQNRITEQNNRQIADLKALEAANKAVQDAENSRLKATENRNLKASESLANEVLKRREADALEIEDEKLKTEELLNIEQVRYENEISAKELTNQEKELADYKYEQNTLRIKKESSKRIKKLNDETTKNQIENTQELVGVSSDALNTLFGENKGLAVSGAIVNGALGVTKTISQLGFPAAIPALAAQALTVGTQIATIQKASKGLMIDGPSHDFGGVNVMTPNGMIEAEGGEFIMNKASTAMFKDELNAISLAGGGVPLAERGMLIEGASRNAAASNLSNDITEAVNSQQTVLVTEDLQRVQARVAVTEDIATL